MCVCVCVWVVELNIESFYKKIKEEGGKMMNIRKVHVLEIGKLLFFFVLPFKCYKEFFLFNHSMLYVYMQHKRPLKG